MSSTNFIGQVTVLQADWANDANDLVYDVFGAAKTAEEAQTALRLQSMALQSHMQVSILGGTIENTVIGELSPAEAKFSRARVMIPGSSPDDVTNIQGTTAIADARALLLLDTTMPTKGDLLVRGADVTRIGVGANGMTLQANSDSPVGMTWTTFTQLVERNPLDEVGQRGFAGDIQIRTGTEYARLPVGPNKYVLLVDEALPQKVRWGTVDEAVGGGGGGGGGGGSFLLEQDVLIIGTDVGAAPEGYTFPEGMSFTEFVIKVSQKTIPPAYGAPTLTLSANPAPQLFEIGTVISPILSESYSAGNAGSRLSLVLKKGATTISTTMPYTDVGVLLTETPISYQETVNYAEGPCLLDNMGQVNCDGHILAGSVNSNIVTFVAQRVAFFGTPTSTPASSAAVRALNQSFNASNNSGVDAGGSPLVASPSPNFIITIPIGATRVVFAYPDTRRDVASVKYQELADSEVKANFVKTIVSVEGAAGYPPVNYKVFTYIPIEPFSVVNHYKVFI